MKILFLLLLLPLNIYASNLDITDATIRLVPSISQTTSMFLTIQNNTKDDISLVKISSELSDEIELHEMNMTGGKMVMRSIESILIKRKDKIELKSGGMHVMIFKIKKALKENDHYKFKLYFSNKTEKEIEATVKSL
jgi:copper(I)-binding protein